MMRLNKCNKILEKYRKIPSGVRASIWFAVCSILQKGIQFIVIPLFTRLLTTEQYGQFTLYQSWLNVISIFATLNLAAGVFNNGMIKYENDRKRYISSMQGLSTIATLGVFVVYILLKEYWDKLLELPDIVVFFMFVEMLVAPALSFWSAKQRFEYKYVMLVFVTLAISIISPAIGLVAVLETQEKGIARILSASIINIGVGTVFYIYNIVKGKCFFQKDYWKFALKFNLPLIPHYLSSIILGQADRIMIDSFYGKTEVAIYSLAYSMSLMMNVVTTSINASLVPWTYQQCKKTNYKSIKKVANIILILMAGLSLVPILLAPELIGILGPAEYSDGVYLVPSISLSVFFIFLYSLFANIEFYFEKSKFIMLASIGGAILNIVLNYILLPLLGYGIAAYTTLACYIMFSFAHYVFMKKICNEKNIKESIYNIQLIISLSILLIIISQIIMLTYKFNFIRYSIIGILLCLGVGYRKIIFDKIKLLKSFEKDT